MLLSVRTYCCGVFLYVHLVLNSICVVICDYICYTLKLGLTKKISFEKKKLWGMLIIKEYDMNVL